MVEIKTHFINTAIENLYCLSKKAKIVTCSSFKETTQIEIQMKQNSKFLNKHNVGNCIIYHTFAESYMNKDNFKVVVVSKGKPLRKWRKHKMGL